MGMIRNALCATGGTLGSRLLGFLRDAAFAWLLGTGNVADALSVALRIPYVFRKLLEDGALSLTLTIACSSGNSAVLVATATHRMLRYGLPALLGALAAAPLLALLLAPGLSPADRSQAVLLLRIALPYALFAMLAANCLARLHASHHFALPGMVPVTFNLVVLLATGGAALLAKTPDASACWFAGGVLTAGLIQWFLAIQLARRLDRHPTAIHHLPPSQPSAQDAHRTLRMFIPALLAAAVPQLAFLLAGISASVFDGGPSSLFFAERLMEFPLAVTAAGLNLVLTPQIASLYSCDLPRSALDSRLATAFVLPLLLTLPAAAGLAACAGPVVTLLLGRGAFDANAGIQTAQLLATLCLALPACAVIRPLLAVCHILNRGHQLVMRAGVALFVSLSVSVWLSTRYDLFQGPAVGICTGLWCYVLLLWRSVRRCLSLRPVCWPLICSCLGSLSAWGTASGLIQYGDTSGWPLPLMLGCAVPAGVLCWSLWMLPAAGSLRRLIRQMDDSPQKQPF